MYSDAPSRLYQVREVHFYATSLSVAGITEKRDCFRWDIFRHLCVNLRVFFFQAAKYGDAETGQSIFSFIVNVIESAIKVWHDTGNVDPRVNFLLDQKTDTEKYAPVVNIDKVLCCCRVLHFATWQSWLKIMYCTNKWNLVCIYVFVLIFYLLMNFMLFVPLQICIWTAYISRA